QAICDILFGDYNPSGKLPLTFYRSVEDIPDYQNYSMQDRTYRYFRGTPVYPFGYGLSYTSFGYSNLRINVDAEGRLHVTAVVTNKGQMDGDEVVQMYVSNKRNFVTPLRSLKGFERIFLKAGESHEVEFVLTKEDLTLTGSTGETIPMKGKVEISVGGCQGSQTVIPSTTEAITESINIY
ncbi:MAG TPA: glycosyl hydrolase, partial [Rikenellaceae bacterium]|nr:glycosyl hydrolase [Rikenellaceae bacterium]